MANLIEGKVAKVLSTRELVINRGEEDGVERGMIFEVLDPSGSEIRDPETAEILGSVLRPKIRVRVAQVQPKLAVARTYRTVRRNVGGTGSGVFFRELARATAAPPRWAKVPETFKTEDAAWETLPEEESFVKVGDPVRQVVPLPKPDDSEDEPPTAETTASNPPK